MTLSQKNWSHLYGPDFFPTFLKKRRVSLHVLPREQTVRQEPGYSLSETRRGEKPIKHVLLARPSLVESGLWKHSHPGAPGLPGVPGAPASSGGTENPQAEKERNSGAWVREPLGVRNCPHHQRNVRRSKKTFNRRYWGQEVGAATCCERKTEWLKAWGKQKIKQKNGYKWIWIPSYQARLSLRSFFEEKITLTGINWPEIKKIQQEKRKRYLGRKNKVNRICPSYFLQLT